MRIRLFVLATICIELTRDGPARLIMTEDSDVIVGIVLGMVLDFHGKTRKYGTCIGHKDNRFTRIECNPMSLVDVQVDRTI
jgi:hypothetical protein